MIKFICSTIMSLLRLTILAIFGVVTFQNHDVNSQVLYGGRPGQGSVEANTLVPPDPRVENEGIQLLLTRLESLCVEKLEYLITDTNRRFQSLETKLSQSSSCPAVPVVQNNENLEAKVENLGAIIQELMDTTRNVSSDVAAIKRSDSSLIDITRSLVNSSSNLVSKQVFNEGLQELKDLQTETSTSCRQNFTLNKQYPRNCKGIQTSEKTATGTYMIQPEHAPKPFEVVCDMETRGGGWTVIQRRLDGSQDFYLSLADYKKGFGNLGGEFWLGLENMHLLTGFEMNELLIELRDFQSRNTYAFYSEFRIGSEMEGYSINALGAYSGNAGDSLSYGAGMKFTTKDYDHDNYPEDNCAQYQKGAWWYNNCAGNNMNGKYFGPGPLPENAKPGIFWDYTRYYYDNDYTLLKYTRMLVRPKV